MSANLLDLGAGELRRRLVESARTALTENGYEITNVPKRGRSVIWKIRKNGAEDLVTIRTTQDRYFAFNRIGDSWQTLDEVDRVIAYKAVT